MTGRISVYIQYIFFLPGRHADSSPPPHKGPTSALPPSGPPQPAMVPPPHPGPHGPPPHQNAPPMHHSP